MGFWLKKVIGYWLMPLPLSLALVVCGFLILRFTARRRLGQGLMIAGATWLALCSNAGVATWMARGLEARFPTQPALAHNAPVPEALRRCQFIAVLGGGHATVTHWPANHKLSSSALARIVEGARLAHALPHTRLIVSGPTNRDGGPSHAEVLAETAVSLGVARERLVLIDTARDTEQEAAAIAALVGSAPVALVTSAWHMPRSVGLCRNAGVDVLPCPADHLAQAETLDPTEFLRWNVGALERSTKSVYERIGATWSWLRGKS